MLLNKFLEDNKVDITPETINQVCKSAIEVLDANPTLFKLQRSEKTIVVGDIHGKLEDLIHIFKTRGIPKPGKVNYIFLGDYVNRGKQSVEVLVLLLSIVAAYGKKFANQFIMLRGNHECRQICEVYGLQKECKEKYGSKGMEVFDQFCEVFKYFSIAAVLNDKYFLVHGGISPHMKSVDDISSIKRKIEFPDPRKGKLSKPNCLFLDLCWSDPDPKTKGFAESKRGCGVLFGEDVLQKFLQHNKLEKMIRSHALCEDGYSYTHSDHCLTIFSASNYCGCCGNVGAVCEIEEKITPFIHFKSESVQKKIMIFQGKLVDPNCKLEELEKELSNLEIENEASYIELKKKIEGYKKQILEMKQKEEKK